ncbi:hypothetical protein F4859DRAFT_509256 [Xylaria cf. heliscus]|nr:hypothetical protein F4859DRAFT_509256 [Xylaria cf. heliscus]
MAGFESTLVTAIVAGIVSVVGFLGITIGLALYWSSIARRIAPNRFAEPMSEKSWPSSRNSAETNSAILSSSPRSSPSSSPSWFSLIRDNYEKADEYWFTLSTTYHDMGSFCMAGVWDLQHIEHLHTWANHI